MSSDHWYFEKNQLINSPSRKHGISEEKEQAYLQQTANLIQEMGRKLQLPLICINTAVLFTQRFFAFHPLTLFEKFSLGASALFLAAKVEETPRKVEHICQIAKILGIVKKGVKDTEYAQEIIVNENVLLETLGFQVLVQHPHHHVLKLCELLQASKTLSQASYIFATYCLHLTRMCLIHKPVTIACLCIYMACKASNLAFPLSREGKYWYNYGDPDITEEILESMSEEFQNIIDQCPDNFKNKTLTSSHENLRRKLTVDITGVPIVKKVDQVDPKTNPTPTASASASNSITNMDTSNIKMDTCNIKMDTSNIKVETRNIKMDTCNIKMDTSNVKMDTQVSIAPQKPKAVLDTPKPQTVSHAHSSPMKKQVIPSSSRYSHPPTPTPINKSAFTNSSNKTERSNQLVKPTMHIDRNSSHPSSLLKKRPEQVVPPFRLGINKLVQNSNSISHTPVNVSTSSSKPVHSLKVVIPKSRFMIPKLSSAAQGDVKSDKMSHTFTPADLVDKTGQNSRKKFKPN